ncbi:MAG: histidine phosphatase family protein [Candidatus Thorarchaeota archaeon]
MSKKLLFLRHSESELDFSIPASQWGLSRRGRRQAKELALSGSFDDVEYVITSEEKKALQTATPIAERNSLTIYEMSEFNELNRDVATPVTIAEYEAAVKRALEHPHQNIHGWERASKALKRFTRGVHITKSGDGERILVVSHGIVLTLYFGLLTNEMDNLYKRWKKLGFDDWGIVKNEKVVKDIIH